MKMMVLAGLLTLSLALSACGGNPAETREEAAAVAETPFTTETPIEEVINAPAFGDYGRLLFPAQDGYWSGETLGDLHLMWYSHIDPEATVEIVNTLRDRAAARETVFYDIYTDAEKNADHAKEDTGLFFFKGEAGKPFAVCNAGGAFANADELEVSTDCYSLWGGSAGARMAAYLGPWARRPSVGRTCQSPGPLPCSIPGTANTIPPGSRPPSPWRGTTTGLPAGGRWNGGLTPCPARVWTRSSTTTADWATALAWVPEPTRRAGLIWLSASGKNRCNFILIKER